MFECYHFKHIMLSSILTLNEKEYTRYIEQRIICSVSLEFLSDMLHLFWGVISEYWLVSIVGIVT